MTFQRDDHVLVSQFIRRGDDTDTDDLDGWVVFYGEAAIVIANTPDWRDLDPEDYFTATYSLDDVIVSHIASADRGAAGIYGVFLFTVMICGAAIATPGILSTLGGHIPTTWPLHVLGIALAGAAFTLALFHGANQGDQK